jgi:hypothetical protein
MSKLLQAAVAENLILRRLLKATARRIRDDPNYALSKLETALQEFSEEESKVVGLGEVARSGDVIRLTPTIEINEGVSKVTGISTEGKHTWGPRTTSAIGVRCTKCFQVAMEPHQDTPCLA